MANQAITGVGFQPKALIVYGNEHEPGIEDTLQPGGKHTFGFAASATQRACNAVSLSPLRKVTSSTKLIQLIPQTGTVVTGDLVSFDADGFTYALSADPPRQSNLHFLALGGTALTNAFVGSLTVPTTPGTLNVTTPGFKPDSVFFILSNSGTDVTNRITHGLGFAVYNSSAAAIEQAFSYTQRTSAGAVARSQDNDACIYGLSIDGTNTIDHRAALTGFTSTGFDLNFTTGTAQGALTLYFLAIKGGSWKVKTVATPTSVTTDDIATPFDLSGFLVSGFGRTALAGSVDSGKMEHTLGSSDGTRQGSVYFSSTSGAVFPGGGTRNRWETGPNGTSITVANSDDTGDDPISTVNSANIVYSSEQVAHGLYSMKVPASGTGIFVAFTGLNGAGLGTTYGRTYFFIPPSTIGTGMQAVALRQTAAALAIFQINTTGMLRTLNNLGATFGTASATLSEGQWYRLEWKLVVDLATGVNGSLTGNVYLGDATTPFSTVGGTSTALGSLPCTVTRVGMANAVTATLYFDDTVVDATDYPGPAPDTTSASLRSYGSSTKIMEDTETPDALAMSAQMASLITKGVRFNYTVNDAIARQFCFVGWAGTAEAPSNIAVPTISGVFKEGEVLTATSGDWSGTDPITYTYQWQRDNAGGGTFSNIAGETNPTHTLVSADFGNALRVQVTATNDVGSATANSAGTGVLLVLPFVVTPATISGNPTVGATLTGTNATWGGSATITYAYQWYRTNSTGGSATAIAGATATTYVATSADVGFRLRFTVTATNSAGSTNASALTALITTVTPPSDVPLAKPYPVQIGWTGSLAGRWRFATSIFGGTDVLGPGLPSGFGGAYDDMSDYLLSFSTKRGRSSTLTQMEMGECELVFNDKAGLFNPLNVDSPLRTSLLPWRPGRLQAVIGSLRFDLFSGYVRSVQHNSDIGEKTTTIRLVDAFFQLDRVFPVIPEMGDTSTGAAIDTILSSVDLTDPLKQDLDTGDLIPGFSADGSKSALALIGELLEAERGTFYINGSGVAVYESRHARGLRQSSELQVEDDFSLLVPGFEADLIQNRARVTRVDFVYSGSEIQEIESAPQEYIDQESRLRFGLADVGDLSTRYLYTDDQALALAKYLVEQTKDPIPRVWSLELSGILGDDFRAGILARELGDHVQVWNASNRLFEDAHIEAIEYRMAQKGDPLSINWTLSKRTQGPGWTFGVSTFGGDAVLSY